jgi:hypothetical protein
MSTCQASRERVCGCGWLEGCAGSKKEGPLPVHSTFLSLSSSNPFSLSAALSCWTGDIEPADICQGAVGNCWLMSALACLAQVDGAIQLAFYTREVRITVNSSEARSFAPDHEDMVT